MKEYVKNRFALVSLIIILFISLALITRIILMVTSFSQINFGVLALIKLYFVGFIYDLVAAVYFVAPVAVYLTLMPNKAFNNRFNKYLCWFFLFILINLLLFNVFSEWFFWEEFGKRFNFIAVDYLVYTKEVVHNILESYPISLLVGSILTISSCLFYLIYKKTGGLDFSFKSSQHFIQRFKISVWFIFLPMIFFNTLNEQSLANISDNQFNNELSKNGLYSLFSAFRNNTLNYKIPLIIYGPHIIKPAVVSKLSSQVDLMPTIFSIMNWSYQSKFYGEDILDDNFNERAFIGTYQKLGFLRNNMLVILEPDKIIHEYQIAHQGLYDVKYEEVDPFQEDKLDAITYYQSASYFYGMGIDRCNN